MINDINDVFNNDRSITLSIYKLICTFSHCTFCARKYVPPLGFERFTRTRKYQLSHFAAEMIHREKLETTVSLGELRLECNLILIANSSVGVGHDLRDVFQKLQRDLSRLRISCWRKSGLQVASLIL